MIAWRYQKQQEGRKMITHRTVNKLSRQRPALRNGIQQLAYLQTTESSLGNAMNPSAHHHSHDTSFALFLSEQIPTDLVMLRNTTFSTLYNLLPCNATLYAILCILPRIAQTALFHECVLFSIAYAGVNSGILLFRWPTYAQ